MEQKTCMEKKVIGKGPGVGVYERTKDLKRMLNSRQLAEAIINETKRKMAGQEPETNIFYLLSVNAATFICYDAGAKKADVWNEGEEKVKIDLPLQDGWYLSDGNPFGIPNGNKSTREDPQALCLVRHQDRSFNGPVGFGHALCRWFGTDYWRDVNAYFDWSGGSGVALIEGRDAAALFDITDPTALRERAAQLKTAADGLIRHFGYTSGLYTSLIKPILDEVAFLRGQAGKIEDISK
jgi:hypothetical protein